jgi:hypothetical protein
MRQKISPWALVCVLVLAGISCDLPESPDFGKGTLTLLLPKTGDSRAALPDSVINSLVYRVTAAGPGETQTLDTGGGGTTLTLNAGTWTIKVAARDPAKPDVTVGSGSAVIAVAAGRNNSVRIPMKPGPAYDPGAAGAAEFHIYTEAELRRVGTDYPIDGSVRFYLEQDIVLTQPWKAIGSGTNPFKAQFDGQGHTITVRAFDSPVLLGNPGYGAVYQGFFAYTYGALIKNTTVRYELSGPADIRTGDPATYTYAFAGGIAGRPDNTVFENIQVTGNFKIIADPGVRLELGGIAGEYTNNTTITNCHVSGDIGGDSASGVFIGGIGGWSSGSTTITGSSFTGRIEGEAGSGVHAGGIVSYILNGGRVETCYAAGRIQGTGVSQLATVGGIAGLSTGTIENCYARTYVDAQTSAYFSSAGGIVGVMNGNRGGATLSGSYALGTVAASASAAVPRYAGGIFGYINAGTSAISYCVALNENIEAAAPNNSTGGIGGRDAGSSSSYTSNFAAPDISFIPGQTNTDPNLIGNVTLSRSAFAGPANQGNYPGWTFGAGGNWKYIAGYDYPVLSWQDSPPADPATL